MSGIFSKPKTAEYTPAPGPSAPVEEATFEPGGETNEEKKKKTAKLGKKRLQVPTMTATTGTGLSTGA